MAVDRVLRSVWKKEKIQIYKLMLLFFFSTRVFIYKYEQNIPSREIRHDFPFRVL